MLRLLFVLFVISPLAHAKTLYDARSRPAVRKTPKAHVVHHRRPKKLIIGGLPVSTSDPIQRSTAALYSPSATGPGGALCTASLISSNTAVTAAHCLQGKNYSPVMIFGNDVRSPSSAQRPVIGQRVNPKYGRSRGMDQGDIAVVRFGGGLPKGYKPAKLDNNDDVKKGDHAILAGYGISNAKTKEGAGLLRKAEVSVSNARKGKSEMIFDQAHGRGACHGDSGGPAFFKEGRRMILGGVTNRSYPNTASDDCAHKVVYTKISAYRPWIEKSEAELNRTGDSVTQRQLRAHTRLKKLKRLARN